MDLSSIANNINYHYQQGSRKIQIGGAVSGLDTASIIEKLLEVEAIPLQRLNEKFLKYSNLQKAYKNVSEKIREFYNFLGNFSLQANLIPKTASVSSSVLSASATAAAVDGSYLINVESVATNSNFIGGIFAKSVTEESQLSELNTRYVPMNGTVRVRVGNLERTFDYSTTDTVGDVAAKLESTLSDLGVTAFVKFQDGRLIIEANTAFQISNVSGNFTFLFRLNDSYVRYVDGKYILESSGHVGAFSSFKTLSDLGINEDKTLTINGKEITLAKGDSISKVVSKINSLLNDVSAHYDDKYGRLVLVSKKTGDELISVSGDSDIMQVLGLSEGTFNIGSVARLTVTFNGYSETVVSKSNSVMYKGLTLNLSGTGQTTVTVSTDVDAIVNKVKDFVNKWNELTDFLYKKLTEDKVKGKKEDEMSEEEKLQGLLKNDSYLRRIFDRFRNFLYQSVNGVKLADLGIVSGDRGKGFTNTMRGKLELDEDKLKKFIETNGTDAVWKFFGSTEGDKGFGLRLKDFTFDLTKFNGEIDTVAGMNGRLEREKRILSKRMVAMMQYIEKKEQMLWQKYSALESALSKLAAQGSFMANAFAQRK
ncbi:flagellar filament capping protein FliD [Fervidobacterium thailandense]|uniref:Flagellar hook-associated protein 2 n=1 Tax=Fervidobacterium thailandense TaxID=1008305 RepID=A0A1E3G5G2_9BACT|nr:flagellar filament capping protein FliD [Fervidobacterium thailandense]ODN30888.1 flagellar hook protein [Fervidobacterium thailandense]